MLFPRAFPCHASLELELGSSCCEEVVAFAKLWQKQSGQEDKGFLLPQELCTAT